MRLLSILLEAVTSPKAIFLTGPSGAGKTTLLKQLNLQGFETINVDDTYEALLKASGFGTDFKKFTPDQIAQAGKFMSQARTATKEKEAEVIANAKNIIIDSPGAASGPLLKKKQELEDLGYDTFMFMVVVPVMTSLDRNSKRDRSLPPSAVIKNWEGVFKNIPIYQSEFSPNMTIINNSPEGENFEFDPNEYIKRYIEGEDKVVGKPKTPEEIAKKKKDMDELFKNIQQLLSQKIEFDPFPSAKSKLNKFLTQ
jgi:predicted kinase